MAEPRLAGIKGASVIVRGGMILGVVVLCGIPTWWWAWAYSGNEGLWASGMAAGLCLLGGLAALPFAVRHDRPEKMLLATLVGMGLRSGIPLGIGLLAHLIFPPLAKAGLLYYLVVFYFPLLAMETYWSLPKKSFMDDGQPR